MDADRQDVEKLWPAAPTGVGFARLLDVPVDTTGRDLAEWVPLAATGRQTWFTAPHGGAI